MAFSDSFVPKGPVNVTLPTLSKGMDRRHASTVLPEGAVYLASNWNATEKGPTRRAGSIRFAGGATVSYAPLRDTIQLFLTNGVQRIGLIDSRFAYLVSGATLSRMLYGTSAGTVRTSGAHVIGNASTKFVTDALLGGDYFHLKPGTASAQEIAIASIAGKSHLVLASTPSPGPFASGSAYRAYKALAYAASTFVDHAVVDHKVVIADGVRPLVAWDGAALAPFDAALTFAAKCVAYWADRLWAGNTIEGSTHWRNRIRWSKVTDHTDFIATPDAQWLDRPYSDGALLRLVPMGKLLAAYYEDRVEIGRPTNYAGDLLPVAFETLDTGGAGLVGQRAVARFYDGHFIVLDDGIYYFSGASGVPQNIGEDVWHDAGALIRDKRGTRVAINWLEESAMFGIPNASGVISCLWKWNYKSKGWSRDELSVTSLSNIAQLSSDTGTWDAASGSWDAQTGRWDDSPASFVKYLALGQAGAINLVDPILDDDADGSTILAVLETGDFSWQAPNDIKSAFSLSIKTDRLMEVATTFVVEGSVNRGLVWKSLGTVTIAANDDEGSAGFKLMGSTMRFRITTSTRAVAFTIAELVLRLRGRGRELRFSTVD